MLAKTAARGTWILAGGALSLAAAFAAVHGGEPAWSAQSVSIKYYDVWPSEPKHGVQFFSPSEGWVGVWGVRARPGMPYQAYLLHSRNGPEGLRPVTTLQLPPDHRLGSFQFTDPKRGWVSASEMRAGGGPVRLWRTEDGGQTWQELHHNIPAGGIGRLHFVSPTAGWAVGGKAVWRTEDGGTTWRQRPATFPAAGDAGLLRAFFLSAAEGWVAGKGVIYHTRDGGQTWTLQYDGAGAGRLSPGGMHFSTPNDGWVAGALKYLAHTQNGGRTWRLVHIKHPRLGPYDRFTSVHFFSPLGGVIAGQHNEREKVSLKAQRGASPIAFNYYRPYLLATFDGGRSWAYHDLPIPVGQWSQADSVLFGINTVDARPEATGIVEVRITEPRAKRSNP